METDKNTAELISCATDYIPSGYRYELKDVEGTSKQWVAKLLCNISSIEDVQEFVRKYVDLNGETVKPRKKKIGTDRSSFLLQAYYRCQHDTRFEKTRDVSTILNQKPCKRFKNTYCPFQLIFKVRKSPSNSTYLCEVIIEHFHNHPLYSLEATSFKAISKQVQ